MSESEKAYRDGHCFICHTRLSAQTRHEVTDPAGTRIWLDAGCLRKAHEIQRARGGQTWEAVQLILDRLEEQVLGKGGLK